MLEALKEAKAAGARNEVPVGAIIIDTKSSEIISKNGNRTRELNDPTAHAEILCIREACQKAGAQRIPEMALYVTLEPCTMCAGAIAFARLSRLIIGASDAKGGGVLHGAKFFEQPTCHHKIDIKTGILEQECSDLLRTFFRRKRPS